MGTTITDLDTELKMKLSRKELLESKKQYCRKFFNIHGRMYFLPTSRNKSEAKINMNLQRNINISQN